MSFAGGVPSRLKLILSHEPGAHCRGAALMLRGLAAAARIFRVFGAARAVSGVGTTRAPEGFVMRYTGAGAIELCKRVYRKYTADAVAESAAAVSYYFLFSFFPFLLFVTALIAYLPLKTPVEHFLDRVRPLLPAQAMVLLDTHLRDLISRERPHLLTLGLLGSFWSASRGVDAVRRALNLAFGVEESRPLWKTEFVSWCLTLAGALLVLVAAAALIAGGGIGPWIAGKLGIRAGFVSVMHWLRWPVLGLTFMTTAGLAYRFLPDVKQRLGVIVPGAAAGALSWVLATWVFGRYVASFGHYEVTYGSLGGVVILLTWLYLSGFITLAGGELNALVGHGSAAGGSRRARNAWIELLSRWRP
jgi:membrane protein